MTVPREYLDASRDFERFLIAARDALGCGTTHRSYAIVRAVLLVFRSHLALRDALLFAAVLPPVLRAIFVSDWDPDAAVPPFGDRKSLAREVGDVRTDHNVAPDDAIATVGKLLADHVGRDGLDRVLAALPPPARAYWAVEG
ncbi:DUF2267 domain-containing protein [Methylobacterium sp. JK268]